MAIDLILGADALAPPLTGIGRYSYELARQLRHHPDVARLRYFSLGSWVADPIDALAQVQQRSSDAGRTPQSVGNKPPWMSRVRSTLAANRMAVRVYQTLIPSLARWQLRGESQAIFHSPNYLVPPFPGKTVNTVHDLSHVLFPEFHPKARVDFMNLAFGTSLKHTTHVITDTETVRQEFIQHFDWPVHKVTAIGLGVDKDYHPRSDAELIPILSKYGLKPRQYALCVGTIEPRKNTPRLLQAYGLLPPDLRRAFPLVLAGSKGWKSDDVHRQMEIATSQGWLRYLSFVEQADLPFLYGGARLFIYPSLYEGFGLPIVEAMASGTPVITSATSCMPEVAGSAAALVDPLDVIAIQQCIQEHLEDGNQWMKLRELGISQSTKYSWQSCAAQTLAVYLALSK